MTRRSWRSRRGPRRRPCPITAACAMRSARSSSVCRRPWRKTSKRAPAMGDDRTINKLAAEAIGTFALVFAGTGAIVVNDVSGGAVTHVGIAITFGLVVMAMIYAVGDVSGAHLNPAVTLGFAASTRFPLKLVGPYIAAQCAGAFLASAVLRGLFRSHESL